MTSVQDRFQAAVNVIKGLPKNGPYQPSNSMMLKFYGLYKQATEGNCNHNKPAFWDIVNKAKWEAWNRNSHLTKQEAMQKYVENLQEIIETMSFTENVQNFVGSIQALENINLDELEIIVPGMKDLAESHPNSPFHSRTNSPQRNTNNHGEHLNLNGCGSSLDSVISPPAKPVQQIEFPTRAVYSQTNGLIESDQSDDEYVDPFDIQNELQESLQRNTDMLKHVQNTLLRMDSDLSAINQHINNLERTLREVKNVRKQTLMENVDEFKHKYPRWWPFANISPLWFALLVLWPLIARRVGKMLAHSPKHK